MTLCKQLWGIRIPLLSTYEFQWQASFLKYILSVRPQQCPRVKAMNTLLLVPQTYTVVEETDVKPVITSIPT